MNSRAEMIVGCLNYRSVDFCQCAQKGIKSMREFNLKRERESVFLRDEDGNEISRGDDKASFGVSEALFRRPVDTVSKIFAILLEKHLFARNTEIRNAIDTQFIN
jgi:hypothetical protein